MDRARRIGNFLAYADDICLLASSEQEVCSIIGALRVLESEWNLTLNAEKTEILKLGGFPLDKDEAIEGVKVIEKVWYLDVTIHRDKFAMKRPKRLRSESIRA